MDQKSSNDVLAEILAKKILDYTYFLSDSAR